MAKVRVEKMNLANALELALERVRSPENMRKYGEMAADMIRTRTRLKSGGGMVASEGATRASFPELADSTIENRKRMQKRGQLSSNTTPKRSNLTATGQMTDSIQITSPAERGRVTVGPTGLRKDSNLSNQEVGVFVTKAGRPFNHLSGVEMKRLNDAIFRDVKAAIKRFMKG